MTSPSNNKLAVKYVGNTKSYQFYSNKRVSKKNPQNVLNNILEVEVCVLVLFPVLVYFVRQSILLFPLPCLSKTSWSRGQAGVDLKTLFLY